MVKALRIMSAPLLAPEPSPRPLGEILAHTTLLDDLVQACRLGRIDSRNWRTEQTPAFHLGLFAFLATNAHARSTLLGQGWNQEMAKNQERFVAPEGMFSKRTVLALVSGQTEEGGVRVAHRGVETRLLIDSQGEPYASRQLNLIDAPAVEVFQDVVFVVSTAARLRSGAESREILRVSLAHPYALTPDCTYLECDDVQEIGRIDLDGPDGLPALLPAPVPIDPLAGFRVRNVDNP